MLLDLRYRFREKLGHEQMMDGAVTLKKSSLGVFKGLTKMRKRD